MHECDRFDCSNQIGLPFECNLCGGSFCSECRLPEKHDCSKLMRGFWMRDDGTVEKSVRTNPRSKQAPKSRAKPNYKECKNCRNYTINENDLCTTCRRKKSGRTPGLKEKLVGRKGKETEESIKQRTGRSRRIKSGRSNGNWRRRRKWRNRTRKAKAGLWRAGQIALILAIVAGAGFIFVEYFDQPESPAGEGTTDTYDFTISDPYEGDPDPSSVELAYRQLLNEERQERGLDRLDHDESMADVSRNHSEDMADRGFYDHENPDGMDHRDRLWEAGIQCDTPGEVLAQAPARQSQRTAEDLFESLMGSPGHKELMMDPEWDVHGVAVHVDGDRVLLTDKYC